MKAFTPVSHTGISHRDAHRSRGRRRLGAAVPALLAGIAAGAAGAGLLPASVALVVVCLVVLMHGQRWW